MPFDLHQSSPASISADYAKNGQLCYQVSASTGEVVFFPRVIAPRSGAQDLEWRVSAGLGTIYAVTFVHERNRSPRNVALVDMDEGFRIMSSVTEESADQARIGQRIRIVMQRGEGGEPPYPVCIPLDR